MLLLGSNGQLHMRTDSQQAQASTLAPAAMFACRGGLTAPALCCHV